MTRTTAPTGMDHAPSRTDIRVIQLHDGIIPAGREANETGVDVRHPAVVGGWEPTTRALEALRTSSSVPMLAARFIDAVPAVVGTDVMGVYLSDRDRGAAVFAKGTSDAAMLNYEVVGRPVDFLLATVVRTRMPVHDTSLLTEDEWHSHALYLEAARKFPLDHCLIAPIQDGNEVIGTLNLGRRPGRSAFDGLDLLKMATLAGQFSATYQRLLGERAPTPAAFEELSGRAQEIAILAAKGLSNPYISRLLGITPDGVKQSLKRTFKKLDVCSRVELAAALAALV